MTLEDILRTEVSEQLSQYIESTNIKDYCIITMGSYGSEFFNNKSDIDLIIFLHSNDFDKLIKNKKMIEDIKEYITEIQTKNTLKMNLYLNDINTYDPKKVIRQTILLGEDSWYGLAQTSFVYYLNNTTRVLKSSGDVNPPSTFNEYLVKNDIFASATWEGYEMHLIAISDLIKGYSENNPSSIAKAVLREIYAAMIAKEAVLLSDYNEILENAKRVFANTKFLNDDSNNMETELLTWAKEARYGKITEIPPNVKKHIERLFMHFSEFFSGNIHSLRYPLELRTAKINSIANKINECVHIIKKSNNLKDFIGYLGKEYLDILFNSYIDYIDKKDNKLFEDLYDQNIINDLKNIMDIKLNKYMNREINILSYAKVHFIDSLHNKETKKLNETYDRIQKEINHMHEKNTEKLTLDEKNYYSQIYLLNALIQKQLNITENFETILKQSLKNSPFNILTLKILKRESLKEADREFIEDYMRLLLNDTNSFKMEMSNSEYRDILNEAIHNFVELRFSELENTLDSIMSDLIKSDQEKEKVKDKIKSTELIELYTKKYELSNIISTKKFVNEMKELFYKQKTITTRVEIYNTINYAYLDFVKKDLDLQVNLDNIRNNVLNYNILEMDDIELIKLGRWRAAERRLQNITSELNYTTNEEVRKELENKSEKIQQELEKTKKEFQKTVNLLKREIN